jgi:hypothetical protein
VPHHHFFANLADLISSHNLVTVVMVSFTSALVAATAVVGALAAPAEMGPHGPGPRSRNELLSRSTPNQQGTNNGYFYQFCMLPASFVSCRVFGERALLTCVLYQGLRAAEASPTPTVPGVNTA